MSKKNAIILILVVFVGTLAALIWFYFTANQSPKTPVRPFVTGDTYDPFGTVATNSAPITENEEATSTEPVEVVLDKKIRQISTDPISGFTVIDTKEGKTNIHYILRANGNIYEAYADSLESKRLSNTTVLKVYESNWLPDGQRLIIRYLKDKTESIETFSVKINPATTTTNEFEGGIDGNFLPENISALATNPLGDKVFYLTTNLKGSTGLVSKTNGLNKALVFESPLVEWNVSWPKEEIITMTTRPAATVQGYMYFLNSKTGSLNKVLGGILGLTTKTNSATTEVLYSDSARNTPRLYLHNVKSGEDKLLPFATFPEKCVWGNTDSKIVYCAVPKGFPNGEYPDLWYQGLANFTDDIWRVNTVTGASTLIADIQKETRYSIDATDLKIDKNDSFLFFTDKTSLTLWNLSLK